jgi:hypothetical protein
MDSRTPGPSKGLNARLVALEAEARYARERYQLYRAKAYGPRLTSAGRLRELERTSKLAENRLARAKAEQGPLAPDGTSGIGGRGW